MSGGDPVRGFGGHRHRKVLAWGKAVEDRSTGEWIAHSRIHGRWCVVGKRATKREAVWLGVTKARP